MSRARDLDGLPERIAAVRHRLGLSQRAFATRAGIARDAVLRYEGGHGRPRADTLERIAQLGGVSVGSFDFREQAREVGALPR
jgi:transcriptional regulator with XRE-family HTH domain